MGDLLNQVVAIHKSRMNADLLDHNIEREIKNINSEILKAAEKGNTRLFIHFECINHDSLTSARAIMDSEYTYYINELKSASEIRNKLIKYYSKEGFDINDGVYSLGIDWVNKIQ